MTIERFDQLIAQINKSVHQPGPEDARARREVDVENSMWGSDYSRVEGTFPCTREHLRQLFHDTSADEIASPRCAQCCNALCGRSRRARAPRGKSRANSPEIAKSLKKRPPCADETPLKKVGVVR